MKHLYIIGGTMGVGKTTVCQILKQKLPNAVFLDGDWCWDSSPFQVTEETKIMVMHNICFLLNQWSWQTAVQTQSVIISLSRNIWPTTLINA